MYSPVKQRITGAIVIISLIVIFVPMILTDRGESFLAPSGSNVPPLPSYEIQVPKQDLPASIPEPPPPSEEPAPEAIDEPPTQSDPATAATDSTSTAPEVVPEVEVAPTPPVVSKQTASSPKPVVPASAPKPNSAPTDESVLSGWVVQLGSFSKQQNAEQLQERLRKKGYASFIVTVEKKSTASYRVRVGPELSKARAEQLRVELDKTFKLKGLLMSYP